jgi:hypothetical protein
MDFAQDFVFQPLMVAEPCVPEECAQGAHRAMARAPTAHASIDPFTVRFLPACHLGCIANGQ